MWFVYILKSLKDNKHYIGCTNNIDRRLREHNLGYNASTKFRTPLELVYKESYPESKSAYERERQIKNYKSGLAFKKLLE